MVINYIFNVNRNIFRKHDETIRVTVHKNKVGSKKKNIYTYSTTVVVLVLVLLVVTV